MAGSPTTLTFLRSSESHLAPMKIRISEPRLMRDLVDSLVRSRCVVALLDPATCDVRCPDAYDEREARVELSFFLRSWQSTHPNVRVELMELRGG
jgi:hypothetical protein